MVKTLTPFHWNLWVVLVKTDSLNWWETLPTAVQLLLTYSPPAVYCPRHNLTSLNVVQTTANGEFIAIDTIELSLTIPEPASGSILFATLTLGMFTRRRKFEG